MRGNVLTGFDSLPSFNTQVVIRYTGHVVFLHVTHTTGYYTYPLWRGDQ